MIDDENGKPGTPQWWRLRGEIMDGLGRAAWIIDQMRGQDHVYVAADGYDRATEMLNEAEAAIRKARDARREIHEITKVRDEAA